MIKNHYLIVGCPRSGTTVIHLLLKGHPNVSALNDEIKVSPLFTKGISTFTFGNDLLEEKALGFSVLFDAITSVSAKDHTTAFGAKCVCHSPTQARVVAETLQKHMTNLKIILMVRNDLVAQYGSMLNARKSGIYHSWYKEFENRKLRNLTINKWVFIRYTIKCLDILNVLRGLHKTHNVIECAYEDFVSNREWAQERLFDFIKVPQVDVTWLESKKVMPDPEEYIKNYSEMKSLLEQLRAEHERNDISPMTKALAKVLNLLLLYRRFNVRIGLLALRRFVRP